MPSSTSDIMVSPSSFTLLLHILRPHFLKEFKNFCLLSKCLSIAFEALLAIVLIAISLAIFPATLPATLMAAILIGIAGRGILKSLRG